jgi:hypothetical protein
LNPIIKPWPFRGWGIDLIGQINPQSSKGHKFVLLATIISLKDSIEESNIRKYG